MNAAEFLDAEAEARPQPPASTARGRASDFLDEPVARTRPPVGAARAKASDFLDSPAPDAPGPIQRTMAALGDAVKALKDSNTEAWARRGQAPAQQPLLDASELERPARMVMTPAGQSVLENTPQPTGGGLEEPPNTAPTLREQWASTLKPENPKPVTGRDPYAAANAYASDMKTKQARTGTALELGEMARADAANELASTDFWRNVGTSVKTLPSQWKQVMGGFLQAVGEGMPQEHPQERTAPLRALAGELTRMGADFYQQGEFETQQEAKGMKPGLGAQAVGGAIQSVGMMVPALLSGTITKNPATVIGIMSGTTGAQSYGKGRDEGLSPAQAATYALLQATIEGGTEYVPIKALFSGTSKPALSHFLNFLSREVPQELLATGLQDAVDKVSIRPDMTWQEFSDDMLLTILSTPLAAGAQVGMTRVMAGQTVPPQARMEVLQHWIREQDAAQPGTNKTTAASFLDAPAADQTGDVQAQRAATVPQSLHVEQDGSDNYAGDKAPQVGDQRSVVSVYPVDEESAHRDPAPVPVSRAQLADETPVGAVSASAASLDEAAHEAATSPENDLTEPTPAQIEAGNYRKGHVNVAGLDISIENPEGSERSGTDAGGAPWSVTMSAHYGYFKGTVGKDKDHVDVYVAPGTPENYSGPAFVVDQRNPETGKFDEHKIILGVPDAKAAKQLYDAHFDDGRGPARRGAISRTSIDDLKTWLRSGNTRQPFHDAGLRARTAHEGKLAEALAAGTLPAHSKTEAEKIAAGAAERTGDPHQVVEHPSEPEKYAVVPESFAGTAAGRAALAKLSPSAPGVSETALPGEHAAAAVLNPLYTGGKSAGADLAAARPDAIRQTIRELLKVPINEGGVTVRKAAGIYKVKPQTIRIRNQNDIGVIAHEVGHHLSETNQDVRTIMAQHEAELSSITPYAAQQKKKAGRREEGFAEFIRFSLAEPAQARAKAPGFHAAFEQYIDKTGDYRAILSQIQGAIDQWKGLSPADRIFAKVGTAPQSPIDRLKVAFSKDRLIFEALDNWHPLKRMVADLAPGIDASKDPFKVAHLLAGDAAIIEDWLIHGSIPFDYGKRADPKNYGKPLYEILKPVSGELREFNTYLIARRAQELTKSGRENLFTPDEIREGLKLATPEFRKAAEEIYAYNDRLLDYAVEGGLLSIDVAEKFRQFSAYIPFYREGEVSGARRRGEIFKRLRGGTDNLRDPIMNLIDNTATIVHATNRNAVLIKARALARSVPGGGRWMEDVPMPERAVRIATQQIIDELNAQGVQIDQATAQNLAHLQTFFVKDTTGDDREHIVVVKVEGTPKAVQINDEMLWQSLEAFNPADLDLVVRLLAIPSDLLRAGVTLSPEFMARNFMRDTLSGFIQSKRGLFPMVGTIGGFKEVATRSDVAKLYRSFGGSYADLWKGDSEQTRKILLRMATRGGFDPRTILTPSGMIDVLHRLGSLSEAGTRVAEFKKSMKPGDVDSLIDAAYDAREVSVDFGMRGHSRALRILTRITPFMNPAMQGLYKAGRTGAGNFSRTMMRGAMLAAFSVALFLLNRDEDWYDGIEPWEKNIYWIFDVGLRDDKGQVIPLRVPKPFEWGAIFGSVPEALTKVAIDENGLRFAKRLVGIFNDVFLFRTIPTALLVPAELWANKNTFTGRQIVQESKEKLDQALQYGQQTSLTARKAGELTDTSPAKIDHTVRGFLGTMGTHVMAMSDLAIRAQGGEVEPPDSSVRNWPVIKAFVHDPDNPNTRYLQEFYDVLKKARTAEASIRRLDGEKADAYGEKHKSEIESATSMNRAARDIAKLRKESEGVAESRDYSGKEKRELINENNARIKAIAKGIAQEQVRQ